MGVTDNASRLERQGRFLGLKEENSRLLRADVAARRTRLRGLPEVVTFNHADICNLRCIMCQRSLGQGRHRLDERVLEHVVRELFPTARKAVLTTAGGDPLAVDYEFMVERARQYGVRLDVVTNGTLLTEDAYRRSCDVLDHVNVSLDSHVPAVYEHIRAGASFERVWSNLEAIAARRGRVADGVLFSLSAVVMRSNLPHLAEFVAAVAPLRPDGVVLQRLLHSEKATPEEEPSSFFTDAEIESAFAAAEAMARRVGVNVFASEFRRQPVLGMAPRAKVPPTIEDRGLCWFIAQNFNVMYTGEVFPCCIPTDLCLGDVYEQDPAEIWNGAPFQDLRLQHFAKQGNLFCSGCIHAPHLPARPARSRAEEMAIEAERERRAKSFERMSELRRVAQGPTRRPIYAPLVPPLVLRPQRFAAGREPVSAVKSGPPCDTMAARVDGGVVALRDGRLEVRAADFTLQRAVELPAEFATRRGTCVFSVAAEVALVGCAESGALWRLEGATATRVLTLSDERAFVRSSGVACARDGTVWVGEYGVFPGARCAYLHRSTDGGRSFTPVGRIEAARHVHRVYGASDGSVVVTTGDLAGERRMLTFDSAGSQTVRLAAWSGFVAACETRGAFHFGTELEYGNGFVSFRAGLDGPAEFHALPADLDLMVRAIAQLDDGALVALLGMDEDLVDRMVPGGPALLMSRDEGTSWEVVMRFADDWSDEPQELVALSGRRVWVVGGAANHLVELP